MYSLLKDVFETRGYTDEFLSRLDKMPSDELMHTSDFVDHLRDCKSKNAHIVVLPDFDMDGIMAGSIGFAALTLLGFHTSLYAPDPKKGYGFDATDIDLIMEQFPDASTIITCDVGISCYEGVRYAREKGLDVIVTDHHKQTGELIEANLVVDPLLREETYSQPLLCGAAVFWKLLYAYTVKCAPEFCELISYLRVFAGIGNVSDMMPPMGETRQLIKDAVSITSLMIGSDFPFDFLSDFPVDHPYRRLLENYQSILLFMIEQGKLYSDRFDETFFGYYLAPMFNSVKRLDEDSSICFSCLFGDAQLSRAALLKLWDLNKERKEIIETLASTIDSDGYYCIVNDVSKGMRGLLANRIMRETGLPFLVLSKENGEFSGSGRSPAWLPFLNFANDIDGVRAMGHDGAFGIVIDNEEALESLLSAIGETVENAVQEGSSTMLRNYDVSLSYDPVKMIFRVYDREVSFEEVAFYIHVYNSFKPYGRLFESPVLLLNVPRTNMIRTMGDEKQHTKYSYPGLDIVCWNRSPVDEDFVSFLGNFEWNEFMGQKALTFYGEDAN